MQQRSPVQIAQLYGPVASALVGGVVAAYAVAESRVDDFSFSDAGVISVVITPQWAGATAAVVAAVGVALLHRWGRGGLASVFAVVGALAIALPAFVPVSAQISVTLNAIGAGAFLAAAAFPTKGHRGAQTALGLGVTTTTLYFGAADLWRDRVPRWSLTLPGDSYPVPSTVPVWILLAATLLVGGVAAVARPNQEPGDIDARLVKLGVVLPLVFTALYVWLGSTTSPGSWVIAVVMAVAVTVALAWRLPPHDGRFVLAGLAVSAVSVSSISFSSDWTWAMPAGAAALVLGVVVGWRRPMPQLGLGLLAVTTLSDCWMPPRPRLPTSSSSRLRWDWPSRHACLLPSEQSRAGPYFPSLLPCSRFQRPSWTLSRRNSGGRPIRSRNTVPSRWTRRFLWLFSLRRRRSWWPSRPSI